MRYPCGSSSGTTLSSPLSSRATRTVDQPATTSPAAERTRRNSRPRGHTRVAPRPGAPFSTTPTG
ncbi:hypothetical protein NFA_21805 [Nocardia farcinica IFM 10152]|uniref:Uncharacterized protein n=1 Tax=Nocardia farcinica (strain IFM 10152) TaxID=247156 RepID=Q5YXR4_NOCFA|nr:hypothetical protein NFA_21805 [Nocardia farcinica IFM 10152]